VGDIDRGMKELLLLLFAEEDRLPVNADGTYSGSLRVIVRPKAGSFWWQQNGPGGAREVFYSPRIRLILECLAGKPIGIDAHALTQWWRENRTAVLKEPDCLRKCLVDRPDLIRNR
jgi:hypothetical protein